MIHALCQEAQNANAFGRQLGNYADISIALKMNESPVDLKFKHSDASREPCFRTDRIKPGFFRIHSRLLHLPASRAVSWSGGRSPGQPTSAQAATRYKPVSRSASRPARSARSAGRPAQPAGHLVMPLTG